ncbi:MAG: hypothetical protein ACMXYC_05020 [Candidatus Woesearchaeota archaeon]
MKVIYDDSCRLCTRFAKTLNVPIQPRSTYPYYEDLTSKTIIVIEKNKVYTYSTALCKIKYIPIFCLLPKTIRDILYITFTKIRRFM